MSFHVCCVEKCFSKKGQGVTLHSFPDPKKHVDLFRSWMNNIKSNLANFDQEFIFRNRRVCTKHFDKKFLLNEKLSRTAVPTLFLPGDPETSIPSAALVSLDSVMEAEDLAAAKTQSTTGGPETSIPSAALVSLDSVMEAEDLAAAKMQSTTGGPETSIPSAALVSLDSVMEAEDLAVAKMQSTTGCSKTSSMPDVPRSTSTTTAIKQGNIMKTKSQLSPGKRGQKQNTSLLNKDKIVKSISILKGQIRQLKHKKNSFKERLEIARNALKTKPFDMSTKLSPAAQTFIRMQLSLADKKSKGRRYTLDEKILSLSLYKPSPKAYRILSKICILPKRKTLHKILEKVNIHTGINNKMFADLKKRVKKMPIQHRLCTVTFDEMAISPGLKYDKKKDRIVGFVDDGKEIYQEFCDHVLVFMVRGVIKKYKQAVSYSFCHGSTKTTSLKSQLTEVIEAVQACGLKVVATVCDQGASNIAAINSLINDTKVSLLRKNEEMRTDYFEIGGKKIFPIYDPPHLIKGIRNNLLNKTMKYSLDGKICSAKWDHIVKLYRRAPGYKGVRMVPKLTARHVIPKLIPKMKVKHSTQVFSSSVGVAMGYMAESGKLPKEAKETADLLLLFDQLFDSVNSSFSKVIGGKVYRAALTPKSPHHKLWRKCIPTLKSMKFVNSKGKSLVVPSLTSWVKTIRSFQNLSTHLAQFGINSLLLRHFNQDPLENFFGSIRAHGHSNIMPDAAAFQSAYRTLLINNLSSPHSVGANCEDDESTSLHTLRYFFESCNEEKINKEKSSEVINEEDLSIEILDSESLIKSKNEIDVERCAAIGYCSGWLLKLAKTHIIKGCKKCLADLESSDPLDFHKFIRAKEFSDRGWLCYPTRELFDFFFNVEQMAMNILSRDCNRQGLLNYISLIASINFNMGFLSCDLHKEKLSKYLVNKLITFIINNWCKEISSILVGKNENFDPNDPIKNKASDHFRKTRLRKRTRQTGQALNI